MFESNIYYFFQIITNVEIEKKYYEVINRVTGTLPNLLKLGNYKDFTNIFRLIHYFAFIIFCCF